MPRIDTVREDDAPTQESITRALSATTEHDGTAPLNESARLALRGDAPAATRLVIRDGSPDVMGYAHLDAVDATAQLFVVPGARQRGFGRALLGELIERGASHVWAFGDLAPACAWAQRRGSSPDRTLLIMQRGLTGPVEAPVPEGVRIDHFRPGDEEAFLAVNAAAFAHHPEQGRMTRADLDARMAERWFDPQGFLLAKRGEDVIGFHWTKRHTATLGEVYVIGVRPDAAGGGLGRALLAAGLSYLYLAGSERVILYVEGDQQRVVRMYISASFEIIHTDVRYRL